MSQDVFTIKARRCLRCGGILTSSFGIREGYGHVCKAKAKQEAQARAMDKNQISLFRDEPEQAARESV